MPNNSNKYPRKPSNNTKKTNKGIKSNTNNKKSKNNKKRNAHPKLKIALRIILIMFLLLCIIGAGVVAAMFFGVFGDDFEITKKDLAVGDSNTIVLDKDGNEIANLSTDEKRKKISIGEMSEYLPKAYVAIEDKRFYKHNGVDIKRTTGAIIGAITRKSSYGGSTITQQLVKNITNEKARSGLAGITRKVKEWTKAIQVERMISKNQILELYLNIIYVGGNNLHGVELGSIYYFNKSAKDLDLAECAFLAGINNAPTSYDPYDETKDQEKLAKIRTDKTLTVLSEMKDQGLINDENIYNQAVEKVNAGLQFAKGNTDTNSTYSYHTDATINAVVEQVMEEKNMSREMAINYVYGSGLTIYSTEDASIQAEVETEFAKEKYQFKGKAKDKNGNLINEHTQAGMVILNQSTGEVVAVGGKLGDKDVTGWNRGTQMVKQTGSSIKPIIDIAPALQEKVITASTVYDDSVTDFNGYKPTDSGSSMGLINIRTCIRVSQNIPMVKIMRELTPKKAIEYMKKMGVTSLDESRDSNSLAIAIGGLTKGISPLEMAGAYATIANDGVYVTPIFYTKVVDQDGNVILTPKQEKTRVYSEQNAYIVRSIMQEPLQTGGTATYCSIPGIETCAKTGSTDDYVDRWLCGMTPYYTGACWFGYDESEPLRYQNAARTVYSVDGRNPAGQLWASIMKAVHKKLPNKNFNSPSGIVRKNVCRITGCIATESCTDVYSEMFTADNVPPECEGHGVQRICKETGKIANEYCPDVENRSYGGVIPKEKLGLWKTAGEGSRIGNQEVTETCDVHKKPEENNNVVNENKTNTNNTTSNNTTNNNNTTEKSNTASSNNVTDTTPESNVVDNTTE